MTSDSPWSTAAFGHPADTSPMELSALGEHLDQCSGASAHRVALHCGAEAMHGVVVARFVTTLVVLALLMGAMLLLG